METKIIKEEEFNDFFKNVVVIPAMDKAFVIDKSAFYSSKGFKLQYGGGVTFQITNPTTYKIGGTTDAWYALTSSGYYKYKKADIPSFDPKRGYGEIYEVEEDVFINTYNYKTAGKQVKGDPSRFINHVKNLLPEGDDAEIIISYMAACVQYKGEKFQWCPVLQGMEGNGKTILAMCLAKAVGDKYSFPLSLSSLYKDDFNFYISQSLFVYVEELYAEKKTKTYLMEKLKPLITNEKIEIKRKYADPYNGTNISNWFLLTNHKDCITFDKNMRRYAVFYCAQQDTDELENCGMNEKYMSTLWNWLRLEDGYGIVTDFLMNYNIQHNYNPSYSGGCHRAPRTTSFIESIEESRGIVEDRILCAIEDDIEGFMGGFISYKKLSELLQELRVELTRSEIRNTLKRIGYILHPYLEKGRTTRNTTVDYQRTTIYVKNDIALKLNSIDPVAQYELAQNVYK